jgi:hypothetical protein
MTCCTTQTGGGIAAPNRSPRPAGLCARSRTSATTPSSVSSSWSAISGGRHDATTHRRLAAAVAVAEVASVLHGNFERRTSSRSGRSGARCSSRS